MKNTFLTTLMLAAVAVAPMFAAGETNIRGSVPFEFVVGGKTLPAGEYLIADSYTSDSLFIRSADRKVSSMALIQATGYNYNPDAANGAMLKFEIINGKHYLTGTSRPGVSKQLNRPAAGRTGILAYVKAVLR